MIFNKPRLFQKPMPPASGKERAVVIAPHQDDETLDCGGRIIQLTRAGAEVSVVYTTDGRLANSHLMPKERIAQIRRQEALAACEILGVSSENIFFLPFHDAHLSNDIVAATKRLIELFNRIQPTEIYYPYQRDYHPDHEASSEAVRRAIGQNGRPVLGYEYLVWGIYHWPWITVPKAGGQRRPVLKNTLVNWLGFRVAWTYRNAVYVNIAHEKERKTLALDQHRSQVSKLVDDPSWVILDDVAEGSWIKQFQSDYEVFRKREF